MRKGKWIREFSKEIRIRCSNMSRKEARLIAKANYECYAFDTETDTILDVRDSVDEEISRWDW